MNIHIPPRLMPLLSPDEFFEWTRSKTDRYELVKGRPRVLHWVKRNHAVIVSNIDFLLQSHLDRDAYHVFQGDFAIPTGPNSIRYADVLVERRGDAGDGRTAINPVVIVEVLSASTYPEAFGPKAEEYLALPTLADYLVLEQDSRCVWHWARGENGEWPGQPSVIEEGTVELVRLRVRMPLDEIYRNVL